jgi:hypothetical protein
MSIRDSLEKAIRQQGKPNWTPHELTGPHPSEPGFAYHVTNLDAAHSIADEGMRLHKPWHGTDQDTWPDGSTDKRAYFTRDADNSWQFAPEYGKPVLLRTPRTPDIKQESTGDLYSQKRKKPSDFEIVDKDGQWHPLTDLGGGGGED